MTTTQPAARRDVRWGRVAFGTSLVVIALATWIASSQMHGAHLGVLTAVLLAVVVGLWALIRHPRGFGIVLLTGATIWFLVFLSATAWGHMDPGAAGLTPVVFAVAAPFGAWMLPVTRGARWISVAAIDVLLLVVATVAPAAPSWSAVAAVAALAAPLAWQAARLPCPERR